jgi:hypothetical protein
MRKHLSLAILLWSILLISCGHSTIKKPKLLEPNPVFLKDYKLTSLPLVMKGCKVNGLPLMNYTDLEKTQDDGTIPYCTFKTNGNYYAVIRLGLADCFLPQLITYDQNGKKIDKKTIAIGYCGCGPGFHSEEYTVIHKDFLIYTSDTISITEVDSLGNEIKSTQEKYIVYKKGMLLKTGKIELTGEIKKVLIQPKKQVNEN